MNEVFVSWSGGKDSCLACYLATTEGFKVRYLANMITEDGKRSWTHGQSPEILQVQAQAMGIPLIQQRTTMANYEAEFKNMVRDLKKDRVGGGVFGDIDLDEHREWVERVCRQAGVAAHLPLWGKEQGQVLREFVDLGFEAVVVAAKADFFGEEILGRRVDLDFIGQLEELVKIGAVTPCGEAGEYHTFVIDGPLFRQRIEILENKKTLAEGTWILEILNAELKVKE